MNEHLTIFNAKSTIKAADVEFRRTVASNLKHHSEAFLFAKNNYQGLALAREKAKNIKWKAIETLDQQLEDFEKNLVAKKGKVIWAETAEQAQEEIKHILEKYSCTNIVKSSSSVCDEIQLNTFLQKNAISVTETALGGYIQQLDEETSQHPVYPTIDKTKQDIQKLLHSQSDISPQAKTNELLTAAKKNIAATFAKSLIGVSGANFLISSSGSIAISENEGNISQLSRLPVHIVIAGIDKVISSITDLAVLWPLLATYGTGQRLTSYNTIINGPDNKTELYVIILDNGRSNMLGNPITREALYCIKCGACYNVCPVYKTIGHQSYSSTYSGPIGSVITPHLKNAKEWKHLSYASTLCKSCTDVCPVNIRLHEQLIENRKLFAAHNTGFKEKLTWTLWKRAMMNRKKMNGGSTKKNWLAGNLFPQWKLHHAPVKFAEKSFNELWRQKHNIQ